MNITPIDQIAEECATKIWIGLSDHDQFLSVRGMIKVFASQAIRQALREREKFMGHEHDCTVYSGFGEPVCSCGYIEAVEKELK